MDDPDREGLFGYHDLTQDGLPLAKVLYQPPGPLTRM
jgi:hypothetical protein